MGSNIWAGGKAGALFHSNDGGRHWSAVPLPRSARAIAGDIMSIQFADAAHGKVISSKGQTWTTTDGGQHWQEAPWLWSWIRGDLPISPQAPVESRTAVKVVIEKALYGRRLSRDNFKEAGSEACIRLAGCIFARELSVKLANRMTSKLRLCRPTCGKPLVFSENSPR
jgi:hypothetical protein